jgi:putative N-acetyltransferase (TIGR04045 family)
MRTLWRLLHAFDLRIVVTVRTMLILTPPFRFVPEEYRVRCVTEDWELRACASLRRQVFCTEQQLFRGDDRDDVDDIALPIAALSCVLGMPDEVVGTVRIHRVEADVWQGSRLAVREEFRRIALVGTELIRHAVGVARARGCGRFIAHVQMQNVPLFRGLHWRTLEETSLHGRPHHLMQVDLTQYAPRTGEYMFVTRLRDAA